MNLGHLPGHRKAQAHPPCCHGPGAGFFAVPLRASKKLEHLLGYVGTPGGELLTSASHFWVTEVGRGHQLPSLASRRQIGWDKKGARHQTMQSKALGLKPSAHASTVWSP